MNNGELQYDIDMISCLEGTSGSETSEGEDDMFLLDSEHEEDQDLSDEEGVNLAEIIEDMASNQACTEYYWVFISLPLLLSLFDFFCPKFGSTCRVSPISLSFVMLSFLIRLSSHFYI